MGPVLKSLPNGNCSVPHWGYVIKDIHSKVTLEYEVSHRHQADTAQLRPTSKAMFTTNHRGITARRSKPAPKS